MNSRLLIGAGNFFFRWRNTFFPAVFVFILVALRPSILSDSEKLDACVRWFGAALAAVGAGIRLCTIGFQYIERGGKQGKVYASFLVQGGVYRLTRNPMYLGNGLIAIGLVLYAGIWRAALGVIAFFVFVYASIIAAEEAYLRRTFGQAYEQYCAQVDRLFPDLRRVRRAFSEQTYDWRKAFRKDMSTLAGLLVGLTTLPVWRIFWLAGSRRAAEALPASLAGLAAISVSFVFLHHLKKNRRFFYTPQEAETTV